MKHQITFYSLRKACKHYRKYNIRSDYFACWWYEDYEKGDYSMLEKCTEKACPILRRKK